MLQGWPRCFGVLVRALGEEELIQPKDGLQEEQEPTLTCRLGLSLGCACCKLTVVPQALGAVVQWLFLFASLQKARFACRMAWETWQSGVSDCIAALPTDECELLGYCITATAAVGKLCHALHSKADSSTCAVSSADQSIPRAACTSPGDIFYRRPKSQLPMSSTHRPHLNIAFPGGVGHVRNVSEPGL